jgi:hypothetical protein
MKFKVGDRVRMLQHADWKAAAIGTIISPGRVRDGRTWYWVQFDERQRDLTDERHGDRARSYSSATVTEPFLELLTDDAGPSP